MVSILNRPPPLDENRVLDAAFRVLEAHGFEGLTIRRIADELGVKNPALYWHFKNKQQIVDRMAERILSVITGAPFADADWRGWLGGVAQLYRRTLLSYRDGAEVLANADLGQSAQFAEFERGIARLGSFGFSNRDALVGMVTVFDYALGITYEHQANRRLTGELPEGGPVFGALGAASSRAEAEDILFESGLALILDGLALRRSS